MYLYMSGKKKYAILVTALFAVLLPTVFLLVSGILADSVSIAFAIFAFYLTLRPVSGGAFVRNLVLTGALMSFSFVFAVFYLQMRGELRELVWGGGSMSSAAGLTISAAQKFDTASFSSYSALTAIDGRLDQNILVGLAIEKLRVLPNTYENGETILMAFVGWVPRFIWTNKPVRGGSAFVFKHTGKVSAEGITFGAGPNPRVIRQFCLLGGLPGVHCTRFHPEILLTSGLRELFMTPR